MKTRISFLGTPLFGAFVLETLLKKGVEIDYFSTLEKDSPVEKVSSKYLLKEEKSLEELAEKSDLVLVAGYGKIIPKNVLEIPPLGFLNLHPSLLPFYRGPSPITSTILNGDKITGVTLFLMDEKMDHGPILSKETFEIKEKYYYPKLEKRLAILGGDLAFKTIPLWVEGKISPKEQDHSKATYSKIIKKEDGKINWEKESSQIEKMVRAYYPWPGAFTFTENKYLKITEAKSREDISGLPGKVFLKDKKLFVGAKKGSLELEKIQIEGKKEVKIHDFLQGNPHSLIGKRLG